LQEVKVRVTDAHNNWVRSGNLLESNQEDYEVLDLMFRDNNMYENEACYQYGDPEDDDRRVGCDGYVFPRPGGIGSVDVVAVVSDTTPPDSITVTITAPTDERGSVSNIPLYVSLYRLNKILSQDQWDAIYDDSYCAGMVDEDCAEIYCRKAPGRFFYGASDPYAISISDDELTTSSSPEQPVGDNAEPCFYVTSSDDMIEYPSGDYQDYACAMGSGVLDSWHACQNPQIRDHASILFAAKYGDGFRGFLETDLEQSEEWQITGACSFENQYYADYKRNVLNYGFEWVKAECQGKEAYYAIQSQADVMFLLSHGEVFGRPACTDIFGDYYDENPHQIPEGEDIAENEWRGQPYLFFFPESPLPPYDETGNMNDIIVWQDWLSNLGPASDADWLVLVACLQLGDTTTCAQSDAWLSYRRLISYSNNQIKSVLGHRDFHHSDGYEVGFGGNPLNNKLVNIEGEEIFMTTFCQYLESGTYLPHPSERWLNYDPSIEYGAMCYMEAAWEYLYYYERICGPFLPDYDSFETKFILTASAVDANYRYIFAYADDPDSSYDIKIQRL
jgi:hypothetical protein